jgi:hypothetical protein
MRRKTKAGTDLCSTDLGESGKKNIHLSRISLKALCGELVFGSFCWMMGGWQFNH